MTQRGFAGNEEWLADFRGGWGSFNDRLALLCEIGEVATARRLEGGRAAARTLEPGELAGALAQLATRTLPARPYWYADGARITLVLPGVAAPAGYEPAARPPCDALCLDAAARRPIWRPRARASSARCRAAAGRPTARCAQPSIPPIPRPAASWRSPTGPRSTPPIPSRSCARSSAPSARPGRAAAGAYFAPRRRARARRRAAPAAARHPARAPPGAARSRASGACAWRATACSTADWEGNGWTAGRNRGTSTWTFAADGRIERLVLRFDPAVPAHGGRMTEAWVEALRAELGDRVHTQPAELAAVARDASHVIGHPEALLYPETTAARRDRGAHRARARRAHRRRAAAARR